MTDKKSLREKFATVRATASQNGDEAARRLALVFLSEGVELQPGKILAGYWPIRTELDPRPLMDAFPSRGIDLALPVTEAKDQPLRFRKYDGGALLARDVWDIPVPSEDAAQVIPDVVLVPGLAFDADGHRLGYGAGAYDRTLAELRARHGTVTVGIGFAEQVVEQLPAESHDVPLDWIITPEGVVRRPA